MGISTFIPINIHKRNYIRKSAHKYPYDMTLTVAPGSLEARTEPTPSRFSMCSRAKFQTNFLRFAKFTVTNHSLATGNRRMTDRKILKLASDTLPRDLILDLFDMAAARARQAHELIRDNTDLSGRSARGLEGQARFRLMEKGFQDVCENYGGVRLEGDVIPGSDLRCFQPFMRFGGSGAGILLGLSSISAPREMPTKNQSRVAGVTLNYHLSPGFDFDGEGRSAKPGDIFVLLMFARDPSMGGRLEEVAIGVIDSKYEGYLAYEPVEGFLASYALPAPLPDSSIDGSATPSIKLKTQPKEFKAPERPADDNSDKKKA
jgi:hypothetical protein